MKNIYRLSMFCMVWALGAFAPLGAQTVVAWTDGASVSYSASSLVSLATCDSIVVSDSWKEADLQKLRAVVPTDETAQLQKVNMSAASFSGDITLGMYSIFSHCLKLEEIVLPNTAQNSKVSLRCAFAYNPKLRRVANLENLQNITSLDTIFRNCPQLQSVAFSAGAPNTNEVKCTRAFEGCTALTEVDLSHFAGLSEGNNMFENCTNLERVRFADTENAQKNSFVERFKGCAKLQTIDNLDKFTNISAISGAFYGCVSLPAVTFCTTPQTMSGSGKEAFRGCEKLQSVANLTIFTNLSNCEAMFRECKLLESVNLPKNSAAKNAKQMFYKCDRLRTADLSMLTALTNFESAFNGCESLETVTLSAAEQAAATKFNSTFSGCKALRKVLNFSKYTQIDDLNNTFKQCAALDSVRFGCNPSAATNATTTFDDCKATCLKFMPCGTKKAASWQDKGTAKTASYNDSTFIYDIRTSDFALKKACDQFDWHGTTYTVSGDYAYTIIDGASNGCDSIDRLRLTICQSYNFPETKSVCDSLLWQGKWRTASGNYTEKYTTIHGCDSLFVLHLTLIPTPQVVVPKLPTYCDRSAALSVAYELLAGQPDRYDLSFDESAQLAGFENVINAFLPPDVIAVTVPPDASEGDYAATLRIYNARATDGCASVSLPLAITVGFDAARYLVQKWNDVIVVNNSGDSDHPMRFVAYQWYKDGQKIADATRQHLYEAGGLDWNAVYTVDLTTEDGRTVRSCDFVPQQPQSVAPSALVVCPNPVAAFAPLTLHLPDAVLSVSICNVQGVCVYRTTVATDVVSLPKGFASGVYVVCAVTADGQAFLAKMIVD